MAFYDLLELPNRLSNPFGHPLQVRTQATFANFRVRLPRGQFNKETTSVVFLQLQSVHVNFRLITD